MILTEREINELIDMITKRNKTYNINDVADAKTYNYIQYLSNRFAINRDLLFKVTRNRNDDVIIYKQIAPNLPKYECNDNDRNNNRVAEITKLIPRSWRGEVYLDYGAGDGSITQSLSTALKLSNKNTYAAEIGSWGTTQILKNNDKFTSIIIGIDNKIPLPDKSVDLVTVLMVLHHIRDDKLSIVLSELNRVTKDNGLIIIREHDVRDLITSKFLDFYHALFEIPKHPENVTLYLNTYFAKYRNVEQWDTLFYEHGRRRRINRIDKIYKPQNVYFAVYSK